MMVEKVPLTNPSELLNSLKATAKDIAKNPKPQASDLKNWTAAFQSYNQALKNLDDKKIAPAKLEQSLQEAVEAINVFQKNAQANPGARNLDNTLVALAGALSKVMNSFVGKVRNLGEIKIKKREKKVEKVHEGKDTEKRDKDSQQ